MHKMIVWLPKVAIDCQDNELWIVLYGENPEFPEHYSAKDYYRAEVEVPEEPTDLISFRGIF